MQKINTLPELLMNQMVGNADEACLICNPNKTFVKNAAFGNLAIATSIHRKYVNEKVELSPKEKLLIRANYLVAFSSFGIYLANSLGML